ncbi:MAG: two-component sensor histidine kinase [Ignavibacteria bacterium RBG_13_36_8]|nr:MAG: two-component sensor histidine kinase [Ignavibacteria bacterium RBG_13_36_8]
MFIPEVILLSCGIGLILFFIFKLSFPNIILFVICIFIVDLIVLYFLGRKARNEFDRISGIINSIRKNEFSSFDDIKLRKYLHKLESEIKEMYIKAQNDIKYLKKLEQIRAEFLANVSHELRTPIFSIQGYIETLLDGAINDKKVNRKFLEKANQHTQNLNNLLNDLIDISMMESGQMRMSFRYFNIFEFLNEVVKELKPIAEEKNIELILHFIKPSLKLYGDKVKLKQVLINLIQNAIKYTEKGSVEIIVNENKRFAEIIVQDSGIGIAEMDIDRIFERFYRVDKDRSRAIGGTGLGLAIVKHILDAHGTKICVKSKLGEGSAFSFTLKK